MDITSIGASRFIRQRLLAFLIGIVPQQERANAISSVTRRTGFTGQIAYANAGE